MITDCPGDVTYESCAEYACAYDPVYPACPCDVVVLKGEKGDRGPPCVDRFCANQAYCLSKYFTYTNAKKVTYNVTANFVTSYLNANLTQVADPLCACTYPSWCIDPFNGINPSQSYTGTILSILDFQGLHEDCAGSQQIVTGMLPSVLFVVNSVNRYYGLGYTYADVQCAIWTLLTTSGTGPIVSDGLTFTEAAVQFIMCEALSAQDAYLATHDITLLIPECKYALVILPDKLPDQGCVQVIIIVVDMDKLCCTCCPPTPLAYLENAEDEVAAEKYNEGNGTRISVKDVELSSFHLNAEGDLVAELGGTYAVHLNATFYSSVSEVVTIAMTVNDVRQASSLCTRSLNGEEQLVSNFVVVLNAEDKLGFYCVSQTGSVLSSSQSVYPEPSQWFKVSLNRLAE